MKQSIIVVLGALALIALGAGGAFLYLIQNQNQIIPRGTPTPTFIPPVNTPTPTQEVVDTPSPSNWLTYTNSVYGFQISYPNTYQALDDKENLYGWPNGIVLLYKGGQSYDLAIEHWDSVAEYEAKYKDQSNLTVKKLGNTYITLLNSNSDSEVDEIIETFVMTSSPESDSGVSF